MIISLFNGPILQSSQGFTVADLVITTKTLEFLLISESLALAQ